MKIHDTQAILNEVHDVLFNMASMYLTGGVKIAPINQDTIFNSFRNVRFALDSLETMALSNPAGKNMDNELYLPWKE